MTTVIVSDSTPRVLEGDDSTVVTSGVSAIVEDGGSQGPQGPAGATGATGATGPQGPQGPQGDPATQTPWAQNIDAAGFDLTGGGLFSCDSIEIGDTPFNPDIRKLAVTVGAGNALTADAGAVEAMCEFTYLGTPGVGTVEIDGANFLALPVNPVEPTVTIYGVIMTGGLGGGVAASVTGLNFNFGTAPDFLGQPDADVGVGVGCGPNAVAFGGTVTQAILYQGQFVVIGAGEITTGTVLDVRDSAALTTWGLMLGPWDSNLRGGIKLGGSGYNEALDTSVLLDLASTTRVMRVSRLTTTERNALTAADGMLIYNSTTSKFQGRAGGAWVDLH